MFIKIKTQGKKTYYELAHSQRKGANVKQYSVYIGPSLALTGREWLDVLASAKGFEPSLRTIFPVVKKFVRAQALPPDILRGLQEATELEWERRRPSSAHRLLGVEPGASLALINSAFRRLSKTHHPDHGGDPVMFRKLAEARDKLILKSTPTHLSNIPVEASK